MKKYTIVLCCAFLGIFGAAAAKHSKVKADLYWYAYDATGSFLVPSSTPPYFGPDDPFGCSGVGTNCSGAFSEQGDYADGLYYPPADVPLTLHQKF
jgi:hypothetical protein